MFDKKKTPKNSYLFTKKAYLCDGVTARQGCYGSNYVCFFATILRIIALRYKQGTHNFLLCYPVFFVLLTFYPIFAKK